VGKGQGRVGHGVELVDGKHQRMHAQQVGQQAVAARLGQQLQLGFCQSSLVASTSTTAASALRGGRDHVARVLLVARRVADDELARSVAK
jgi:hypothetical protein